MYANGLLCGNPNPTDEIFHEWKCKEILSLTITVAQQKPIDNRTLYCVAAHQSPAFYSDRSTTLIAFCQFFRRILNVFVLDAVDKSSHQKAHWHIDRANQFVHFCCTPWFSPPRQQ